jgi:hypothetical protein
MAIVVAIFLTKKESFLGCIPHGVRALPDCAGMGASRIARVGNVVISSLSKLSQCEASVALDKKLYMAAGTDLVVIRLYAGTPSVD